jgi:hypothetical protein
MEKVPEIDSRLDEITPIVKRCIKSLNRHFKRISHNTVKKDTSFLFHFYREKYLHYILYKRLEKNLPSFIIDFEYRTDILFRRNKNNVQSKEDTGHYDIVILDKEQNKIIIGIEIYLGYEHNNKHFSYNRFREHLEIDFNKLNDSPKVLKGVILNFFYHGKIDRSTPSNLRKKQMAYDRDIQKANNEIERLKLHAPKKMCILMFTGK